VSLILEALRKLERDKDAPERGFVVMTHVPWARGGGPSRLAGIGALALAVAIGALTVALWRGRGSKPSGPEAKAVTTERPSVSPAVASPASPPPFEARALAIESVRRSAPTAAKPSPAVASATPRPTPSSSAELKLNAISRQDGKPVAILNDRLVREGDVFDGIRVLRIGETEVEVEVRGLRRVLTF
jgi:hypothetical protein